MSADEKKTPASAEVSRSKAATALLPKFISHRERDVATIGVALEHKDFATVARLGHNLRGNGVSYGFPEIGALGLRLETAARAKDEAAVAREVSELEAWIRRVRGDPTDAADTTDGKRSESGVRVRALTSEVASAERHENGRTDGEKP